MMSIVEVIEDLLTSNFKKYDQQIKRMVLCSHCLASGAEGENVNYFTFNELVQKVTSGVFYVECHGDQVLIRSFAPDISFTDVPLLNNIVIERKIGEGLSFFCYVNIL